MRRMDRLEAIIAVLRDEVDRRPHDMVALGSWHLAVLIRDVLVADEDGAERHDAA